MDNLVCQDHTVQKDLWASKVTKVNKEIVARQLLVHLVTQDHRDLLVMRVTVKLVHLVQRVKLVYQAQEVGMVQLVRMVLLVHVTLKVIFI